MSRYWFTPDDPQDSSPTSTGTFNNGQGDEYRCVRIKKDHPNEDRQVRFMATHMVFADVIERFGPKIYGWDHVERCVYVEYIGGVSLKKYIEQDINPWTAEGYRQLQQVVHNTRDHMISLGEEGYVAICSLDGYKIQPDMSVRQVDFHDIYYFDQQAYVYRYAVSETERALERALRRNVLNRTNTLSNADLQAQLNSVQGMVVNLDMDDIIDRYVNEINI